MTPMTRPDEESDTMLMALADGELDGVDAARLRARIAADPALAARYGEFVETRALLQAAFPPEPVPDRLLAAVMQGPAAPSAVQQGGAGAAAPAATPAPAPDNVRPFRQRAWAGPGWGLAVAASLLLVIGGFWVGRSTAPLPGGGADIGALTAGLATGTEARLPDGSTARVLGSYQTDLGLCRLIARTDHRHLTCRDSGDGGWAMVLSVQAGGADSFLPASDMAAGVIDGALDVIGAGPPLDAEAEALALSR